MKKSAIIVILLGILSVDIQASEWTGTWASSMYSDSQLDVNFQNVTLRQVVRVSIPGNKIRLKFSNLFGTSPLVMQKVHLAQSAGGHSIDTATDIAITFSGSPSVTIPAGGAVLSDGIDYSLPALTNIAVSIYFGSVPSRISGHVGSRATSYYQSSDAVSASSLISPVSSVRWYVIAGIDVYTEDAARAVVAYGDSITDGMGSTTDAHNRWTDLLATRLHGNTETADVGVLNQGISATLVAYSGLSRLQRDVLDQTDVRYLVILYGVNDILSGNLQSSQIISAYQTILTEAHSHNILVYGGTIMPFGLISAYTAAREATRQEVNNWIRHCGQAAGGFDTVIDFDAALRDPADHTKLLSSLTADGIHPNPAGYQLMAQSIDLSLFMIDVTPPAVPTGLTANPQSYRQIDLDWNDNDESDFAHYNVRRSATAGGPYSPLASVTASFHSDTGLSASTTYYYVVSAVDIFGNESESAAIQQTTSVLPNDTEPPTPNPAAWVSVPFAVSSSAITMTAATGSDLYGPVQYFFEETSGNPGGTDSGWQTSCSYTDTGLLSAMLYTYSVQMRDDLGNIGGYSISKSATTKGPYEERDGILSMEAENGRVGNRWLIGVDAGASNDAYIEIDPVYNHINVNAPECVSADCIVTYDFIISISGNYQFWFRMFCTGGYGSDDSFFWRIDSGNWIMEGGRAGVGSWYSIDHAQVDSLSTGNHVLEISYRENGTRLDKFVIQLDGLTAPTDEGPAESYQSAEQTDTAPAAPTGLVAAAGNATVSLDWADSTEPDLASYSVYRSTTSGSYGSPLATGVALSAYTDNTAVNDTIYYYTVTAVDASAYESSYSNEVTATPYDSSIIPLSAVDFESGLGDWVNITDDDTFDWLRNSGGTLTTQTGPDSGAHDSTWYVYLETSPGAANSAGNTAILQGPEIGGYKRMLTFYYHMYGDNIGTLNVDVYDGTWHNTVWNRSGEQHLSGSEPYIKATVDLTGYTGPIQIRFRAVAAGGGYGDMAIDGIKVTGRIYGDMNGDRVVDAQDLPEFMSYWLQNDCDLDLDGNCVIDLYEFAELAGNWLED